MDLLNIADDYVSKENTKQFIEDDNFNNVPKLLISSIPGGVFLICLIGISLRTTLKRLLSLQLNNG